MTTTLDTLTAEVGREATKIDYSDHIAFIKENFKVGDKISVVKWNALQQFELKEEDELKELALHGDFENEDRVLVFKITF